MPPKFEKALKEHSIPFTTRGEKTVVDTHDDAIREGDFPHAHSLSQVLLHLAEMTDAEFYYGDGDQLLYGPKKNEPKKSV